MPLQASGANLLSKDEEAMKKTPEFWWGRRSDWTEVMPNTRLSTGAVAIP